MLALVLLGCSEPSEPMLRLSQDAAQDMVVPGDVLTDEGVIQDMMTLEPDANDQGPSDAMQPVQDMDADIVIDVAVDLGPSSGPYTTAQVDEIFERGCGSCHNSTANPPLGGGVASWINRGSGQSPLPLIVPGNHQRSYLYHKLADTHREPPSNGRGTGMPMGRQLYSESRLERIAGWIDNL